MMVSENEYKWTRQKLHLQVNLLVASKVKEIQMG